VTERLGGTASGGRIDRRALLLVPGLTLLLSVFLVPLILMAVRSVTDPSPRNYLAFVDGDVPARVLAHTFSVAVVTTVVCLALGYPYAYAMHKGSRRAAAILTIALLLPFWSSVLVRAYAWLVLLRDTGVINGLLVRAGLIDKPLPLVRTTTAVIIGMAHILLPFMVLPVYAAMRRIDASLLPAAAGLGASPVRAMWKIFFPLTLPGVYAGSLLVLILSLGFYVVPAMLGGPRSLMFAELIVGKVYDELEFGVGSALAIVLVAVALVAIGVGSRFFRIGEAMGQGDLR
jgi:putative spermidine/putrescine transport system permease protein